MDLSAIIALVARAAADPTLDVRSLDAPAPAPADSPAPEPAEAEP